MMKVKGPTGAVSSDVPPAVAPQQTAPSAVATEVAKEANRKGLAEEWKRLKELGELPHRQLIGGAASLFKGVFFPSNLMDPRDAKNDPKYMRLLAAVLGLEDLDDYFRVADEDDDDKDDAQDDADADDRAKQRKKK